MSISLDPGLRAWLEARVGPGKEFASFSHGVERAIAWMKERMEAEAAILKASERPRK